MEEKAGKEDKNPDVLRWASALVIRTEVIVTTLRKRTPLLEGQARVNQMISDIHQKYEKPFHFPSPTISGKNISISVQSRSNGNVYFKVDNLDKACEEYTKSIAHAPPGSQELGLAFANRSAVLFRAKLLKDCIHDINRALENDYPDNLKSKLYHRKAACHQALNPDDHCSIEISLSQARQYLHKVDQKKQQSIQKQLDELEASQSAKPTTSYEWNYKEIPPKLSSENSTIPGLTKAVKLAYSEKFGRHIVATRDIKLGEVLGVQKPYARILNPDMIYKNCWHCGDQVWSGLPCPDCSNVIFCSVACRDAAQERYHDIECHLAQQVRAFGLPNGFLMSLRLAVLGFKEAGQSLAALKKLVDEIEHVTDPLRAGLTNGELSPENLASAYSLVPHCYREVHEEAVSFVQSFIVAHLLGKINKDAKKSQSEEDKLFKFIVRFIEKNNWIITCNVFELGQFIDGSLAKQSSVAMLPAFSLFNSSCVPTIHRSHCGEFLVYTAVRPIKKGDQVFESYGPYYFMESKTKRQEFLNDYHFVCECEACTNNWSVELASLPKNPNEPHPLVLWTEFANELSRTGQIITKKAVLHYRIFNKTFDTSSDVEDCIKLLNLAYRLYHNNSVEIVKATRMLIKFYQIAEKPYLTLE